MAARIVSAALAPVIPATGVPNESKRDPDAATLKVRIARMQADVRRLQRIVATLSLKAKIDRAYAALPPAKAWKRAVALAAAAGMP